MPFRPMRRKRQELPLEEAEAILRSHTHGTLAVMGDDDYPYAVPLSYVYHDGTIYVHSAMTGHKVDAIRRHDKVSFCVVDQDQVVPEEFTTYFRSVIAFGRARIIADEQEKLATLGMLGRRYYDNDEALAQEMAKGASHLLMIAISVDHLTGKEAIELVRTRPKVQS